jgi:hypothetical protein
VVQVSLTTCNAFHASSAYWRSQTAAPSSAVVHANALQLFSSLHETTRAPFQTLLR